MRKFLFKNKGKIKIGLMALYTATYIAFNLLFEIPSYIHILFLILIYFSINKKCL